jgi:diguanylate cyclase (GGDEF)-like protein/PAS domain S-box-containing protein
MALQASEASTTLYLESALAALRGLPEVSVIVFDLDLRCVVIAGQTAAQADFASVVVEGCLIADVLPAERWLFWEPLYRAAIGGESNSVEVRGVDASRWYRVEVGPWHVASGVVAGGLAVARDITERKRSRDRVEGLVESAPDAIVVADDRGVIVMVNAQTEKLFGYDRGQLLGNQVELLVPKAEHRRHVELRSSYSAHPHTRKMGVGIELRGLRKDGSEFPVEISLSPLATEDGMLVSSAIRDVSGRRLLENVAARLAAVVESSADAIISATLDGAIISANPAAERLYGHTEAEVIGENFSLLVSAGHEDGIPALFERIGAGGRVDQLDVVRRRTDGSLVDVSLTLSPVHDRGGRIVGVSMIGRDVTEERRAEAALERARDDIVQFFGVSPEVMAILDTGGKFVRVNPALERLLGISAEEIVGRSFIDFMHPDERQAGAERYSEPLSGAAAPGGFETRYRCGDGSYRLLRWSSTVSESGLVYSTASDVTEHKRAERELQRLADAAEHGTDAVISIDLEARVQHWNRGAERLYGFSAEEAIGRRAYDLPRFAEAPQDVHAWMGDQIAKVLAGETVRALEVQRRRKDGTVIDVLNTITHWQRDGRIVGATTVAIDITERKQLELRLQHLADRDPLTGILNRRRLIEELERQLRYAARSRRSGALLAVDLDHFKLANDTYGHAAGDRILRTVTEVLLARTRETDVVARLGGDEFTVILPEAGEGEAVRLARDLRQLLREPQIGAPISISVGIALFGEQELTTDEILVCADTALYEAKERGGDQARVYSGQASGALTWVQRIRTALVEDCFALYGQPIIDLRTEQVTHHELLIRMISEHGEISPAEFIPTAERFGLICDIDRWVTRRGLRLALDGQGVSINLSAQSIGDQPIIASVRAAIAQGLNPAKVIFEITETAALSNITAAQQFAATLTDLGCSVALDDFGTGFGSFSQLKHIPATYLKIDIELVRKLTTSETDQQIVKATIAIAHSLNKLTIAEGVEDATTLAALREYGADQAQGFHIGRPKPIALSPLPDDHEPIAVRVAEREHWRYEGAHPHDLSVGVDAAGEQGSVVSLGVSSAEADAGVDSDRCARGR